MALSGNRERRHTGNHERPSRSRQDPSRNCGLKQMNSGDWERHVGETRTPGLGVS